VLGREEFGFSLDGVPICFVGEVDVAAGMAVVAVVVLRSGDGDAGDSGRRKGDVRGELKERGDGLYWLGVACGKNGSASCHCVMTE
jgi:hypothetical protein